MKLLNDRCYFNMQKATLVNSEDWKVKRLKYLAEINPSKEEIEGIKESDISVTFLPMEKVSEYGEVDGSILKHINQVWNGFTYFRINDVIIAKITPCFENGKGAILTNLENNIGFGSTEFHVLRPNLEEILAKYLYYITKSYMFMKMGEGEMIGAAGQKRVPQSFLENLHFPIPSIKIQEVITNYLDYKLEKITSLISKKQKLIDLLKEERAVIISEAVTKGTNSKAKYKESKLGWLSIPEHWKEIRAKNVFFESDDQAKGNEELLSVSHYTGVTPRTEKKVYMFLAESYEGYKLCKKDDLVINTMWAWMGALGISEYEGIVSAGYGVYRMKDKNSFIPMYLNFLLRTPGYIGEYIKRSKGIHSSRWRLYPDEFFQIIIICPPIEEQREIVAYIQRETHKIDQSVARLGKEIALLQEYRTALISEVVTGKIDVREEVAAWT